MFLQTLGGLTSLFWSHPAVMPSVIGGETGLKQYTAFQPGVKLLLNRLTHAQIKDKYLMNEFSFYLTFKPSSWFEQGLLQGTVEMKVESLVLRDIIPHSGQQHQVIKPLSHSLFQIGREDSVTKAWTETLHCTMLKYLLYIWYLPLSLCKPSGDSPCCLVHGRCSPGLRLSQIENLLPVCECWDYFKRLWQFATAIFWQNLKQKDRYDNYYLTALYGIFIFTVRH